MQCECRPAALVCSRAALSHESILRSVSELSAAHVGDADSFIDNRRSSLFPLLHLNRLNWNKMRAGCFSVPRLRTASTGRDRDDERRDFSGFSVRPTKRQSSAPPVRSAHQLRRHPDARGVCVPGTAMASDELSTYKQKRDSQKTQEPSGQATLKTSNRRRFFIQKHDATRLLYDLRLERDANV